MQTMIISSLKPHVFVPTTIQPVNYIVVTLENMINVHRAHDKRMTLTNLARLFSFTIFGDRLATK